MDLNNLALWGSTWGMRYHPQKCNSFKTRNLTIKNYPLLPIVKESRDPIPDVFPDAVIV
jgi:hypothetical protein